ncbi:MAG: phosphoesterase [Candidatus Limnocylindrales bacterium]
MTDGRPRPAPGASSTSREPILGLPRSAIPGGLSWRGVRTDGLAEVLAAFAAHGEHRVRAEVEDDPSFQQLIPYVVVRDADRVFLMRRLRAGADTRLHDRWSIGVGGHIGESEGGLGGGLAREWSEELVADWTPEFRLIGLLNDDTDPVGAVHLGVVYEVDAAGRAVAVRETHKLEGAFAPLAEADALDDRLETWSRLVLDHLLGR